MPRACLSLGPLRLEEGSLRLRTELGHFQVPGQNAGSEKQVLDYSVLVLIVAWSRVDASALSVDFSDSYGFSFSV